MVKKTSHFGTLKKCMARLQAHGSNHTVTRILPPENATLHIIIIVMTRSLM